MCEWKCFLRGDTVLERCCGASCTRDPRTSCPSAFSAMAPSPQMAIVNRDTCHAYHTLQQCWGKHAWMQPSRSSKIKKNMCPTNTSYTRSLLNYYSPNTRRKSVQNTPIHTPSHVSPTVAYWSALFTHSLLPVPHLCLYFCAVRMFADDIGRGTVATASDPSPHFQAPAHPHPPCPLSWLPRSGYHAPLRQPSSASPRSRGQAFPSRGLPDPMQPPHRQEGSVWRCSKGWPFDIVTKGSTRGWDKSVREGG